MPIIVLADGGGPAAFAALEWLRATSGATVVTVTVDFGQERDLEAVRDRALAAGAARAHVLDRRAAFARELLLPALKAGADLQPGAWGELAWPALAQALVDVAVMEGAAGVAHGCAASSRGGAQLEAAVRAIGPDLMVIAAGGEDEQRAGAAATASRAPVPEEPAIVDLAFSRGVPTALNGIEMPLEELLGSLETIAGAYAASRHLEPGHRSTAPVAKLQAMAALASAHGALRRHVVDGRLGELCDLIGREYAALVTGAGWFTPMRRALDGFADEIQARVTGTVRLRLSSGRLEPLTVSSPFARPAGTRAAAIAPLPEGHSLSL